MAGVVSEALPIAVAVVLAPVVHKLGLLIAADQFVGILFLLEDFFVEAEGFYVGAINFFWMDFENLIFGGVVRDFAVDFLSRQPDH